MLKLFEKAKESLVLVTEKDIAKLLNISEASVSLALNNKAGISSALRQKVFDTAQQIGYDYAKLSKSSRNIDPEIAFIIYLKTGAIISGSPFFEQLFNGVSTECSLQKVKLTTMYVTGRDELISCISSLPPQTGILLLATEMERNECKEVTASVHACVILDAFFEDVEGNYVLINNVSGAYIATQYLIQRTKKQPGYLRSSYSIPNFDERADGFYKAVRSNGFSTGNSIVHRLAPSAEGAYTDIKAILLSGEKIADCYFADHDPIAAGAMRAFKEFGKKIPDDISIIGFDNIPLCEFLDPPLSTINVPKAYMGSQAVLRLLNIMRDEDNNNIKIEIHPQLIVRKSC